MRSKIITIAAVLFLMITLGEATVYINETVGDFRISFEDKDDTNIILKGWDLTKPGGFFGRLPDELPQREIKESFMVMAGEPENNSDIWSGILVLIMDEPFRITDMEKEFFKNSSEPYVRIFDRTIDGHNSTYGLAGNGSEDPEMERIGFYWLDVTEDGMATELVTVMSKEAETVAENMINTVHVEKINRQ